MSRSTAATSKKILDNIREVTGASEEDVVAMLQICNGDANEATERLLESKLMGVAPGCRAPRRGPLLTRAVAPRRPLHRGDIEEGQAQAGGAPLRPAAASRSPWLPSPSPQRTRSPQVAKEEREPSKTAEYRSTSAPSRGRGRGRGEGRGEGGRGPGAPRPC